MRIIWPLVLLGAVVVVGGLYMLGAPYWKLTQHGMPVDMSMREFAATLAMITGGSFVVTFAGAVMMVKGFESPYDQCADWVD